MSISTVGRILKPGVERKRVRAVAFYYGRVTPKRRRQFKHHAKRWHYGMKAKRPGELLQIEHMRVCVSAGFTLKDFKATGPVTGTSRMRACSTATSRTARRFLACLRAQPPFALLSVQVDGGVKFRDEFAQAGAALGVPRCVLPPRKPKYNGCAERANGASRYEFYPFYQGSLTVAAVNRELSNYQWTCNHYRPHDSLALMTPTRYYQKLTAAA